MDKTKSPLSKPVGDPYSRKSRKREYDVFGLTVHMTGSTIVGKAVKAGIDPVQRCHDYYTKKDQSAHYLIGYDGTIYLYTQEMLRSPHVGVYSKERTAYLNGSWKKGKSIDGMDISPTAIKYWERDWPHYKSPQHLFPSRSVNNVYIGVEMPPCGMYKKGKWEPLPGLLPLRPGLRHTLEQHVSAAVLACDIAERHEWPDKWWEDPKGCVRSPRLLGHEDVDLYGRSNKSGGWDPGYLRKNIQWDWDFVYSVVKTTEHTKDFKEFNKAVRKMFL